MSPGIRAESTTERRREFQDHQTRTKNGGNPLVPIGANWCQTECGTKYRTRLGGVTFYAQE